MSLYVYDEGDSSFDFLRTFPCLTAVGATFSAQSHSFSL